MSLKVKVTAYNKKVLAKLDQALVSKRRRALTEATKVFKKALVDEMRRNNKTGRPRPINSRLKSQYATSRASAMGESLGTFTGKTESRIRSDVNNNNAIVGFLKGGKTTLAYKKIKTGQTIRIAKFDPIKYWEENGRPTLLLAYKNSKKNLQSTFRRVMRP
jgi:phage gpG-like protein